MFISFFNIFLFGLNDKILNNYNINNQLSLRSHSHPIFSLLRWESFLQKLIQIAQHQTWILNQPCIDQRVIKKLFKFEIETD